MPPARRTPETADRQRAELVEHARRIVERDGPGALTMRALAAEAGCAVGLPYKLFNDRHDLVNELMRAEYVRLRAAFDELVERAGTGTIGGNLAWFAELLLDSPALALGHEVEGDEGLGKASQADFQESGLAAAFDTAMARYLAAEQAAQRVAPEVDQEAFGFVIVGAIHNLLVSGEVYPRPSRAQLRRLLTAVADRLAPTQPGPAGPPAPTSERNPR